MSLIICIKKIIVVMKKMFNLQGLILFGKLVKYSKDIEVKKRIIINRSEASRPAIPKIIWLYWHDENLPEIIRSCISTIKEKNPDFQVMVLNKNNAASFLPGLNIYNPGNSVQIYSDLLRINLLRNYGGIWIDASVLIFSSLEWVSDLSEQSKYDLIGFYRARLTKNFDTPVVESWFLAAPPNNRLINKWCDMFNPVADMGLDKYYDMLRSRSNFYEIKQNINIPKYLSLYLAYQLAVKEIKDVNLYLRCVEYTGYFYQESYPQNNRILAKVWCETECPHVLPPLIKLTSQNRNAINECVKVENKSIAGCYLFK